MSRLTTKPARIFSSVLVYALIIAAAFVAAHSRVQSAAKEAAALASTGETNSEIKPFFSISTNRTYSTAENPRLWLDHRGTAHVSSAIVARSSSLITLMVTRHSSTR